MFKRCSIHDYKLLNCVYNSWKNHLEGKSFIKKTYEGQTYPNIPGHEESLLKNLISSARRVWQYTLYALAEKHSGLCVHTRSPGGDNRKTDGQEARKQTDGAGGIWKSGQYQRVLWDFSYLRLKNTLVDSLSDLLIYFTKIGTHGSLSVRLNCNYLVYKIPFNIKSVGFRKQEHKILFSPLKPFHRSI